MRSSSPAPEGRPANTRLRRLMGRLALAAILCGYAGLAFGRLYRPDPSDGMSSLETGLAWLSLMATTFLPHAGATLAVGLVLCAAARVWRPAVAGVPFLALSLGPWAIGLAPARTAVSHGHADTLLVLSANLLGVSRSDEELLDQIATHEPDLILLQEVRPAALARLRAALGERYAHVAPAEREHLFGEAVFSRLPFTREARVIMPEDGRDLPQVMAWVQWQGRELCAWNIHLHSPVSWQSASGQARLAWEMGRELDALAAAGTPAIVAGDFNSPWAAQPLDAVRERGYREAHREAGRGIGRSWPSRGTLLRLPPGIRIDHVAYSQELECVQAWGGEWTSSDHRPQFARFVWSE